MTRRLCDLFNCNRFFRLAVILFGSLVLYLIFGLFVASTVSLNISVMIWMLIQFSPNLTLIISRSQIKKAEWKNFEFVKRLAMRMGLEGFLRQEKQSALVDLDEIVISIRGKIYFGKEHFKTLSRAAKKAAAAHELSHMKSRRRMAIMLFLPIGMYLGTVLSLSIVGRSTVWNLLLAFMFFASFPFSVEQILWTDEFRADQESARQTNLKSILSLLRNEGLINHNCSYSTHPPVSDRISKLLESSI